MKLLIIKDLPGMNIYQGDKGEFDPALCRKLVKYGYAIYDGYEPQEQAEPKAEGTETGASATETNATKTKLKK